MSQHKATLRKSLRSALANKKLADALIDALAEMENNWNAAMAKLEADGVVEITSVTTVADVAGSLNSTYFTFSSALDAQKYYVWYNINSAGVDPAVAGRTGIMVAGATNASANTLATATRAAITAAAGAYVTVGGSSAVVQITNNSTGVTTDAADGTAATGFAISVTQQGDNANTHLDTNFAATLNVTKLISADAVIHGAANEATYRKVLRSGLTHKKLADSIIDTMASMQVAHNALMAKLDAQAGSLTSTNFSSSLHQSPLNLDSAGFAQDKSTGRKILRSAFSHKKLGDAFADGIMGLQSSFNSALSDLDAGHINSYMAPLEVPAINPDGF